MNKRVLRTITNDKSKEISTNNNEIQGDRSWNSTIDWTQLPGDIIIHLFSLLNYRDRANLSSVCQNWWSLGASPCLWLSLDLQAHKFDISTAPSLAFRCSSLQKLCFDGEESAEAIISLKVRTLIEIRGNFYGRVNDVTLSIIVDMNKLLEVIEFNSGYYNGISSEGIKSIAMCCLNLKKLWLSDVKDVNSIAINALSNNCRNLVDIAFTDCGRVDEIALTKLLSVKFLSIAGTKKLDSNLVIEHWIKFAKLLALDISRTPISANAIDRLLSYSPTLKVLCALYCPKLEVDVNFSPRNEMGIKLISMLTCIPKLLDSQDILIMPWIEQVLSRSLLHLAAMNYLSMNYFWIKEGLTLMTNFLKSSEEDVQKRAIRGIALYVTTPFDGEVDYATHDQRIEAILDGMASILNLVKSSSEGVQLEVMKGINMLFSNENFVIVTFEEGVKVIMKLLESTNKSIIEEASNGLRYLREGVREEMLENEYKNIIYECGGLEILKNLLQRWTSLSENVLGNVVGTLACMTSDEKISIEITRNGCLNALVTITQECLFVGVLELIAFVFANLTRMVHTNEKSIIVGHKLCVFQGLVGFIRSQDKHICEKTVEALNNLSFDERNREEIVAVDGIEALVYLAKETTNYSWKKWKRVSGVENLDESSKPNNIAIGQIRHFGSQVSDALSIKDDIHVTIMRTLWNLVFKPDIALRLVEKKGIQVLVRICLVSGSELARFLAVLVMAYIFHILPGGCTYTIRNPTLRIGMKHIEDFINSFLEDETLKCDYLSLRTIDLKRIVQFARIKNVYQLECSEDEIARFVNMLRSSSSPIKSCAIFALMQFTASGYKNRGYKNREHHIDLIIKDKETIRILRSTSKCSSASFAAKTFSKIQVADLLASFGSTFSVEDMTDHVLRNLDNNYRAIIDGVDARDTTVPFDDLIEKLLIQELSLIAIQRPSNQSEYRATPRPTSALHTPSHKPTHGQYPLNPLEEVLAPPPFSGHYESPSSPSAQCFVPQSQPAINPHRKPQPNGGGIIIRSKNNIVKPIKKLNLHVQPSFQLEFNNITQALCDLDWRSTIQAEFDALHRNNT
ncbi:protein ARABIDILLO 1-like [Impatiens glandulifera]|uniref:protein ARABIDILLO 1-like n=1 Tax=Impatiens glandulifera TaxID=253017 RepID=UPI001FB1265B|nr:protein ARABIDILLO 1-like [Impatiens glandulifera]